MNCGRIHEILWEEPFRLREQQAPCKEHEWHVLETDRRPASWSIGDEGRGGKDKGLELTCQEKLGVGGVVDSLGT